MTTLTLLGCDGSTWPLMGDSSALVRASENLGGLHLPKVTHRWATSARQSGRTWKGSVMDARAFTLNLFIYESWVEQYFWQALSTDETSQLVVNGSRTLTVRLDEDNDFSYVKDPAHGMNVYPISFIADRPEWVGAPVTSTFAFQATATDNYYGSVAGVGPPFYIGASSLFDTASASNPGDLPAYPTWAITGPVTTATVGILGKTVTLPFPVFANQTVYIDTAAQTITDDQGSNLWPLMGYTPVDFAPIPPGDEVPVAVGMDGAAAGSSVSVTVTPLYRRAW